MSTHLSEQEIIRREKLAELNKLGINAYPAPLYPVTHYSTAIKAGFNEHTKEHYADVCVAGRIMSINDKGKVFFFKIQDSKGLIQVYVRRDDICPGEDKSFFDDVVKHGLDLGDFIGVQGFVFTTRTGETVCPAPDSRCQADRYGDWKCSAPGGDVTLDFHGNVVCGAGQCVKNINQEVMCSTQARGGAALDRYGQAVCAGGCALARADACTPLKR